MPAISKIRFTNVVYENGGKRYNDDVFQFDGYNGAILLENGGGKTVFVQTALQAILPHFDLEERKLRETLSLESNPCHIAIEWILNDNPRRYLVTSVTLFLTNNKLDSYRYVYEYSFNDSHTIEHMPFVKEGEGGSKRASSKGEIADYYQAMQSRNMNAKTFKTIKAYHQYIEDNYKIIPSEWRSIGRINSAEGGVEDYFENCKTTGQLVDRLLIPVVEEAISENGTKDFVATFEEQRERFKRHRQLRERIEESKLIEEKINSYVNTFENYNAIYKEYIHKREYAKGIYEYVDAEKLEVENKLNQSHQEQEKIQKELTEWERKKASYEIALLEKTLESYKEVLTAAKNDFNETSHAFHDKSAKYNNLKIAKLKLLIKELEDSIKNNQEQLSRLEKTLELDDIRKQLEENSCALKGYFVTEEEKWIQEKEKVEIEDNRITHRYNEEKENLARLQDKKETLTKEQSKKEGQISEIKKELKHIKENIVALNVNEDVKQQQQTWIKRVNELEEINASHKTKINNIILEKASIHESLKNERETLSIAQQEQGQLSEKMMQLSKVQENLLLDLKTIHSHWYHYDSIYKKERAIISHLESKLKRVKEEKEGLLKEERIAGRYIDEYGDNQLFTVEPLLEQWVNQWKNQFKAIETGTQYIQRASQALKNKEMVTHFNYWSLAIIVADEDVEKLKDKINEKLDQVTYPIAVLGQEEAMSIVKGNDPKEETMILPKHWHQNLDQDAFEKWKVNTHHLFQEKVSSRHEKEAEIETYKDYLKRVSEFLNDYPYDVYIRDEESLKALDEKIAQTKNRISEMEEKAEAIEQEVARCKEQISDNKDEISQLNQWIKEIQRYLTKEKELEKIEANGYQLRETLTMTIKAMDASQQIIKRQEALLKELNESIWEFKKKIEHLKEDALYKEVQDYDPHSVDKTKKGLEEERQHIKNTLSKKQGNIQHHEEMIKKEHAQLEEAFKNLERERKATHYDIDETLEYHLYGDSYLENLLEGINVLKPIKEKQEKVLKEKQKQYDDQLTKVQLTQEQFFQQYHERYAFEAPIEQVDNQLSQEKKAIIERQKRNGQHTEQFSGEYKDIESCLTTLKVENGRHDYLLDSVQSAPLEEGFNREFPYKRKAIIEEHIQALESIKEKEKVMKDKLGAEKTAFINFCEGEIKDPRLREKTVSGVRQKDKYEEILQWQDKMKKSIQQTIRLAEDDMREHDKDLEQFVNHLFIYLRTITEELSMIPKKTRIKVEDKWKDIYIFNIPEWKEEEGKEAIRNHIDWMILELDNNQFFNEDGTENSGIIRKEIEKWLDTKQLLPIVLNNRPIKVSCRKVTNDNKVSGSLTSWESSNRWSGGEKWSKNMTLFLGILNYVAEKRQGITQGIKINRTVIVDNPFGKASSGHVLDPVFYIAEKLGFQIIALTAHTEGNFIRNYFPVVYSCRLREATNNRSLIIDKEKEIQYAFFKDKSPEVIDRLQEKKQLSLFEI